MLVDTHCHIHEADYPLAAAEVLARARMASVAKMICVGTNETSSEEAMRFAAAHDNIFASIGVHPHDTKDGWERIKGLLVGTNRVLLGHASSRQDDLNDASLSADMSSLLSASELGSLRHKRVTISELALLKQSSPSKDASLKSSGLLGNAPAKTLSVPRQSASSLASLPPGEDSAFPAVANQDPNNQLAVSGSETGGMVGRGDHAKLVAIGEIGLDYFYTHSPRETQIKALEEQIQVALDHNLPIIFHVREAFDDFWPIFDNFHGIKGELHSFTDNQKNLDEGLRRGLYVGVNGISTFTKDEAQKQLFAHIPLERMLLETDAPFLTPAPKRGTVNEPAFVSYVASHHATIRGISPEEIAETTSTNASTLFAI